MSLDLVNRLHEMLLWQQSQQEQQGPSAAYSTPALTSTAPVSDDVGDVLLNVLHDLHQRSQNASQNAVDSSLSPWSDVGNWTDLPDLSGWLEAGGEGVGEPGDGAGGGAWTTSLAPLRLAAIASAYALVVAVSLFGNGLVVYVVARHRHLRSVTHTFLANVALSDLLMTCLNVPLSVARVLLDHWPFGEALCRLVPFVQTLSVYVSSLTMAAIAVDRYRAILTPLKPRLRPPHGLAVLLAVWLLAALAALPYALYSQVVTVFTYRPLRRCQARFPTPALQFRRYLTLATFATQYLMPLSISALAYGAIVRRLWKRSVVGAVTDAQRSRQDRAKRKTIQMLLVVISLFACCWLPLNVYHLVSDVASSAGMWRHNSNAFLACHWLAMSSVCYNPFVYCWLNAAFRDAVKSCGRGLCWSAEPASFGRRRRPGGSGGGGGRHRPSLLNNTAARPETQTTNTMTSGQRGQQDSVRSKTDSSPSGRAAAAAPASTEETALV